MEDVPYKLPNVTFAYLLSVLVSTQSFVMGFGISINASLFSSICVQSSI